VVSAPVESVELSPIRLAMVSETLPGTLRGYRAWSVMQSSTGPFDLAPINSHQVKIKAWNGIKATAECGHRARVWTSNTPGEWENEWVVSTHEAPKFNCSCGLYARYADLDDDGFPQNYPVYGSIKASGRIILQERGFRSQFAEVEALCLGPSIHGGSLWEGIRMFGHLHNIPVFYSMRELQKEFPPADVSRWTEPFRQRADEREQRARMMYLAALTSTDGERVARVAEQIGLAYRHANLSGLIDKRLFTGEWTTDETADGG